VGPILLSVNPYSDVGNPLTLTSTRGVVLSPKLLRVVQEAVRQQSETGYPQAIILSGEMTQLFLTVGVPYFHPCQAGRDQEGKNQTWKHKLQQHYLLSAIMEDIVCYLRYIYQMYMAFWEFALLLSTCDWMWLCQTNICYCFYFQYYWQQLGSNLILFNNKLVC
jgi:hypothetical protein